MMIKQKIRRQLLFAVLIVLMGARFLVVVPVVEAAPAKKVKGDSTQPRTDYIARLQQQDVKAVSGQTVGSLWSPNNTLADLGLDYKARKLNDTIVILVAVQTTAAQSGDSSYSADVPDQLPAITGLAGAVKTTRFESAVQCQLRDRAQGRGRDRLEYDLPDHAYRAGGCGSAERQSCGRSAAQDLHE